jgi:hypothetical protein
MKQVQEADDMLDKIKRRKQKRQNKNQNVETEESVAREYDIMEQWIYNQIKAPPVEYNELGERRPSFDYYFEKEGWPNSVSQTSSTI